MEDNLLDFCEFKRRKEEKTAREERAKAFRSVLALTDMYFKELTKEIEGEPDEQA